MRGMVVCVCLALGSQVGAEPQLRVARWQQSTSAPPLTRVWGIGAELYGVGASGIHRSTDGGATWTQVGEAGAANGVWGTGLDDVWVVRARTLHHSTDAEGVHWLASSLPVSSSTVLEGMWGVGRDRYVFGTDRSSQSGVVLHSRDGGTTWQRESVEIERVAGIWGSSESDVYAVGARGAILRSKGDGTWRVTRTGTGSLEGIWGASASAIYAVGSNGTIVFSKDGKTWTPQQSGASYTLSSIVGLSNRELFVGSADGAPLRSNDGTTWKPISALVPKGNVGAAGSVVVGADDVQYLTTSASAPLPFRQQAKPTAITAPVPQPVSPPMGRYAVNPAMTDREAIALRLGLEADTRPYPYARDLLRIAASHFGDPLPPLPRLIAPGTPPTIRVRSIKGCAAYAPLPQNPFGVEIAGDVTCKMTCKDVTVSVHADISRDGKRLNTLAGTSRVTIKGCTDQRAGVRIGMEALTQYLAQNFITSVENDLAAKLTKTSNDARIDALAYYVLIGGKNPGYRQQLATALNVPETWPGFFWNAPSFQPLYSCSGIKVVEQDGDTSARNSNYVEAAATFAALAHCGPGFQRKAFLHACNAGDLPQARAMFPKLSVADTQALLPTCLNHGIDPSKP